MPLPQPNRRALLAGFAATLLARPGWAEAGSPAWLACAREAEDRFALFGLRRDGSIAFRLPLPARGHAGARHPHQPLAVIMARRPGLYALVLDCVTGARMARLTPPEGLQFNGHAAFLQDGAVLATTEQRASDSAGRIGLWDSATWQRIGEWATGGIGPHEALVLPDGRLAVANGGIATDPTDRRKLNLPVMHASLAVLDRDGALDALLDLPAALRRSSIRHLALRADGRLAFAMQWEGDTVEPVPLLGLWQSGEGLTLAVAPESETLLMQGYAGSVAWSEDGTRVAITSPRGGRVQIFDAAGGFLSSLSRGDICGLAPSGAGFLASDGSGLLMAIGTDGARPLARHPVGWDNHLVAI